MVPGSEADILQAVGILIAMLALGVVLWRSLGGNERPEQEKSEHRALQRTTTRGADTWAKRFTSRQPGPTASPTNRRHGGSRKHRVQVAAAVGRGSGKPEGRMNH
jgi:hypothetical protein